MNEALLTELNAARAMADQGGLPIRRKDADLYALLARMMAICETVERDGLDGDLRDALKVSVDCRNPELIGKGRDASNNGRGRRYVETGSDTFILVCRYVLPATESTVARHRYSVAIREAAKRQIGSENLAKWLAENGGVNTLFKGRPLTAPIVSTKTLHLNQSVIIPKSGKFVLTLERDHRGFFNVVTS